MASGEMTDDAVPGLQRRWIGRRACPTSATAGSSARSSTGEATRPCIRPPSSSASRRSISSSGPRPTPAWAASIARSTSCCRCSRRATPRTSTMSNSARRGRWRSNVWTYPGASSLGLGRAPRPCRTIRPSSRRRCSKTRLLDLTNRGDIVLDPFLGSGSTLIAAEKAGRVCRGVELDPLYVDVIIRRYELATGKSAVLQETGETFGALADRREREAVGSPRASRGCVLNAAAPPGNRIEWAFLGPTEAG